MKNLKIKKLLALAIAGVLSVGLVACGSSDVDGAKTDAAAGSDSASGTYRTLEDIKKDGTINIGVFSDKNPFGYVDENGEYQGYDVYFANRLAKDLGVKVNFVSTEAANRIEYLQTGKLGRALALYSYEADVVGLLASSTEPFSLYPPNITCMVNRDVIGIVTKIDKEDADTELATRWLQNAGCKTIFYVNSKTGEGVSDILEYLREPGEVMPWEEGTN